LRFALPIFGEYKKLHSIWQITLIAVVTGIVLFALRHKAAQVRYWVANAALLAILLATPGTFSGYKAHSDGEKAQIAKQLQTATPVAALLLKKNDGKTVAIPAGPITPPSDDFKSGFRDYFEKNLPLALLIRMLGLAIGFFRMMGNISYVYYLRQRMNFRADPYWSEILQRLVERSGFNKSRSNEPKNTEYHPCVCTIFP